MRALIFATAFFVIVAVVALVITVVRRSGNGEEMENGLVKDETIAGEATEDFYRMANFYLFGEDSKDLIRSNYDLRVKYHYKNFSDEDKVKFRELAEKFISYVRGKDTFYNGTQRAVSLGTLSSYAEEVLAFEFEDPKVSKDEIYSYHVAYGSNNAASKIVSRYKALSDKGNPSIDTYVEKMIARDNYFEQALQYAERYSCYRGGNWSEGQAFLSADTAFTCLNDNSDVARQLRTMLQRYDNSINSVEEYIAGEQYYFVREIFNAKAELQGEYVQE